MATTQQNKSTQTANQTVNNASTNDVKSIADALAALPKETEQTMKGFLDQQMANAKNVNDALVEQFGSAIDNSEIAATVKEVNDAFRKSSNAAEKDDENEKRQTVLTNIQNDLDRILEIQGDSLRAELTRDEAVNDANLNEVENKSEEKADEETDVVKEDIKPAEVKVDVQLPEMSKDDSADESESNEPSKEETLLGNIEAAQKEQNALLNDIRDKLTDADANSVETDESESDVPSRSETLLGNIESAQNEQNDLLNDIGQKLTDVDTNEPDTDEIKANVPSNEENLLKDIVTAQDEQNTLLNDIGQKLTEVDEGNVEQPEEVAKDVPNESELRVSEVNDHLGNINDTLDDILEQFGDSVANTDVNEPMPIDVHVDVESKQTEKEHVPEETTVTPQSVELGDASLDSLREIADIVKQNEDELIEKIGNQEVSTEEKESANKNSITELANDISGASDSMNNQDDTPLKTRDEEKAAPTETAEKEQSVADNRTPFDVDTNQASAMEEQSPVLDARMDMAARAERDITPVLNDVQMFNRMSLTKEEIHVLASEIGKAVAENMIDREGDKKRDAAYLEEVERIIGG
ncbi:MAG: hypothetical protein IKN15_02285 [Bacteroidaceae bacterium]|nr:hypothetical protein [Bacteroidaceae bacterium]